MSQYSKVKSYKIGITHFSTARRVCDQLHSDAIYRVSNRALLRREIVGLFRTADREIVLAIVLARNLGRFPWMTEPSRSPSCPGRPSPMRRHTDVPRYEVSVIFVYFPSLYFGELGRPEKRLTRGGRL